MLCGESRSNAFEGNPNGRATFKRVVQEIVDYVFNNYEWAERLDDEADRIILKYRNKGKVGREKTTVKKALLYSLRIRRVMTKGVRLLNFDESK